MGPRSEVGTSPFLCPPACVRGLLWGCSEHCTPFSISSDRILPAAVCLSERMKEKSHPHRSAKSSLPPFLFLQPFRLPGAAASPTAGARSLRGVGVGPSCRLGDAEAEVGCELQDSSWCWASPSMVLYPGASAQAPCSRQWVGGRHLAPAQPPSPRKGSWEWQLRTTLDPRIWATLLLQLPFHHCGPPGLVP